MNAAHQTVALVNPTARQLSELKEWGLRVHTSTGNGNMETQVAHVTCDIITAREMRNHFGTAAFYSVDAALNSIAQSYEADLMELQEAADADLTMSQAHDSRPWDR